MHACMHACGGRPAGGRLLERWTKMSISPQRLRIRNWDFVNVNIDTMLYSNMQRKKT